MKFYIASSFKNKELVQKISIDIRSQLGWKLTYDWTQNERAESIETLTEIGVKEFAGVLESDVVIVILPGGKGCHIEMGIALGSKKLLFLYDPDRILNNLEDAAAFYFLPEIKHWNGDIKVLNNTCCS
ncbi:MULTISPECIES: group-specific protein [Fictibacillus]|jgi:hypothetical protein|uniref:group-specific protein n=1 Tax=Fictibacillus TaxID=1329200 RepID=UPI001029DFC7|nr:MULTISPECIES: group-specific protein [Fictibacillus]RZT22744.1 hypothetical protein EV282_1827 [Fictibacillus sp. BK138]